MYKYDDLTLSIHALGADRQAPLAIPAGWFIHDLFWYECIQ